MVASLTSGIKGERKCLWWTFPHWNRLFPLSTLHTHIFRDKWHAMCCLINQREANLSTLSHTQNLLTLSTCIKCYFRHQYNVLSSTSASVNRLCNHQFGVYIQNFFCISNKLCIGVINEDTKGCLKYWRIKGQYK